MRECRKQVRRFNNGEDVSRLRSATALALASLGEDANLIGAAGVWHYRFGVRTERISIA